MKPGSSHRDDRWTQAGRAAESLEARHTMNPCARRAHASVDTGLNPEKP
jgi:hypothetical protein